jgi:C-terminal processing protease CtpA/Prc
MVRRGPRPWTWPETPSGWRSASCSTTPAPPGSTTRRWKSSAQRGAGNIPARPLAGRGLDNLVAFARLLGYVRYFHPSDQVAAADWERFAIDAIEEVEPAKSSEELAAKLTELFAPMAPTVQVFAGENAPPLPEALTTAPPMSRILAWKHVGVDLRWMIAFQSVRGVDPSAKPGEPYAVDLGGGVRCRVPLALYVTGRATHPLPTTKPRPLARPAPFRPTGDDRSTRLADVALVWNIMQHFYPFFDEVKVDWPAVLRASLMRAATDADATAFHDTLRLLIARLDDGHGVVRGGSGNDFLDGALPLAWDWIEDKVVVVNADAQHAGPVKPGDVVTKIDGKPMAQVMRDTEELVSGATPQFRHYRALMDLRNGPAGSRVTLELQPPTGAPYTVTLQRQPADDTPLRGPGLREARLERLVELQPSVWYVDLDRFTDADFDRVAMPKLLTAKAAVFDVRGYPALSLAILTRLTDKPLSSELYQDVVTHRPDRTGTEYQGKPWSMPPATPRLRLKAAFLTDGRAVSYAETFLAIVARHKLGPIVGGATSGTNGGVNVYIAPGGYRVSFTGQKARKLDGAPHHGIGVRPTVPVTRTVKAIAAGKDEMLEKAVELVTAK